MNIRYLNEKYWTKWLSQRTSIIDTYLREVRAEELVDVQIVERLSFIHQNSIYVINERRTATEHRHASSVDMLRVVYFIPQLGKIWHVKRNTFIGNHRRQVNDRFRDVLLVDGNSEEQVNEMMVWVVEVMDRGIIDWVDTLQWTKQEEICGIFSSVQLYRKILVSRPFPIINWLKPCALTKWYQMFVCY